MLFCTAVVEQGVRQGPACDICNNITEVQNQGNRNENVTLIKQRGQTVGEVLALKPHGVNQFTEEGVDKNKNINSSDLGGTSATYRIAKLKRDAPEIAERRFNSALASPVDIRTL